MEPYREYNQYKCDCSRGYPAPEPIYCPGEFCQSDTCLNYFNIWKEIFPERSQMTQQYFDDHITMCTSGIYHWNDGISYQSYYKIMSLNMSTMKVEEDIVMKTDSALHTDMVSVTFSNMTVNNSTADHPYLVRGKGWCSASPDETMKKHRMKA